MQLKLLSSRDNGFNLLGESVPSALEVDLVPAKKLFRCARQLAQANLDAVRTRSLDANDKECSIPLLVSKYEQI